MAQILKADTEVKVVLGPFVDVTDGFTPETGVTLTGGGDNADEAELLKHDSGTVVDISSNTWAAITSMDGHYNLTLTTSNLDTEGMLRVAIQNDSVHRPVYKDFMVVNANAYDSLYAASGTDLLQIDAQQWKGGTIVTPTTTGVPIIDLQYTYGTTVATLIWKNYWASFAQTANISASTSTTVTLTGGLSISTNNDAYNGRILFVYSGTGFGQSRIITDYVGSTQVATVYPAFTTPLDGTSDVMILPQGPSDVMTWAQTGVSLSSTTALPEVDAKSISDDATAANNLELDYDGTGYAKTNSTVGTVTTLTGHTAQTGDSFARLGAPAGASVSADIAAIEAQTDDIGVAGAGLTAIPWNASWDAEVQSEVTDALEADGLDHLVSDSVSGSDIADNSIIAKLVSKESTADWDDFVNTTDSLQALLDYIKNDTFSEVASGAPSDTPTLTEMIRELYWAWKNKKTVTADTLTIRNSADSADLHSATISDDSTTFTKGELGA